MTKSDRAERRHRTFKKIARRLKDVYSKVFGSGTPWRGSSRSDPEIVEDYLKNSNKRAKTEHPLGCKNGKAKCLICRDKEPKPRPRDFLEHEEDID